MRERGEDAQFGLQRYAVERFLYRLGESAHRDRFILKGAAGAREQAEGRAVQEEIRKLLRALPNTLVKDRAEFEGIIDAGPARSEMSGVAVKSRHFVSFARWRQRVRIALFA